VSDDAAQRLPGGEDATTERLDALTDEILPALIARLRASRLGELEVRSDGWRVRLRRDPSPVRGVAPRDDAAAVDDGDDPRGTARSPAVGYFSPVSGLAVGRSVQAGDALGQIDVLGIGQEVVAPIDGIVGQVLAEEGQAVEYGQALAVVDPLEADIDEADADALGRATDGAA
jgi:biotin carboxyl carrier protein